MTMPNQDAPEGQNDYDVIVKGSDFNQDITEANVKDIATGGLASSADNVGNGFLGFFDSIFSTIAGAVEDILSSAMGNYDGDRSDFIEFRDKMRDLDDAIDYLRDISGYCTTTQGHGEQVPGNWGGVAHYFDFNSTIGPTKNAHQGGVPLTWREPVPGIIFESYGTWEIDAQLSSDGEFTIGGWAPLSISITVIDMDEVAKGNNGVYSQKTLFNEVVEFHRTYHLNHTVVIPEGDRYGAIVEVNQGRNGGAYFPKGDRYCHLKVNRWDIRTDNDKAPDPEDDLDDPDDLDD